MRGERAEAGEVVSSGPENPKGAAAPALTLFLIGVMAIAMVGFLVGIGGPLSDSEGGAAGGEVSQHNPHDGAPHDGAPHDDGGAPQRTYPSSTYTELRTHPIGPNRDFQNVPFSFSTANAAVLGTQPVTREMKTRALAERAERRAFNGAPPTIPHAVDAVSSAACLGCHGTGVDIAGRVARPIPHAPYENCQQCHAAELDTFESLPPFAESVFVGLPAPFEGTRAWIGAPPVIPHSSQMREECLGCHGPLGREGLRTSHPERKVCTQCHAFSAKFDHVAGVGDPKGFGSDKVAESPGVAPTPRDGEASKMEQD